MSGLNLAARLGNAIVQNLARCARAPVDVGSRMAVARAGLTDLFFLGGGSDFAGKKVAKARRQVPQAFARIRTVFHHSHIRSERDAGSRWTSTTASLQYSGKTSFPWTGRCGRLRGKAPD